MLSNFEIKGVTVDFQTEEKILPKAYRGVFRGEEHENGLHFGPRSLWPEVVKNCGQSFFVGF